MPNLKQICFTSVLIFALLSAAIAQESISVPVERSPLTITAAASGERVRITAPSSVVQMRVEVYSATGEKLFDNEIRGGNVFDWHLQDGQAQRLPAGTYVCVVTAKSISGKLTQKMGAVSVAENAVSVQPGDSQQLSARQAETIGPVEDDSSWTILGERENRTAVVIAHDGTEGQLTRGRGALSFRIGDFFSGTDKEQMRLTEEGNLGIGTAKPKARLDVEGMIRAREGFLFSNGSALNVNDKGALTLTNSNGNVVPNVGGTGNQGRLAKWADNSGNLGDSVATDTGTGLQLTAAPSNVVDTNVIFMNGNDRTAGIIASSSSSFTSVNGPYFALRGNTYNAIPGQRGLFAISGGTVSSPTGREGSVIFNTGSDQIRMLINPAGNVGIGTTAPAYKLHVVGQDVRVEANAPGIFPRFSFNFIGGNTDEKRWQNYAGPNALTFSSLNDAESAETYWLKVNRGPATAISSVVLPNGNVGIGSFSPSAKLSVVAPNSTEITGAAMSSTLRTTAGTLGATAGDELSLASIGFLAGTNNNSSLGIRARRITSADGWTTAAIGLGMDVDNTVRAGDATVWLHANGNVGIGQSNPTAKLSVEGTVQSNSGGFKFPDGTVQTTAAPNTTYTYARDYPAEIQLPNDQSYLSILHLNLPAGTYVLTATTQIYNTNSGFRNVNCKFSGETAYYESTVFEIGVVDIHTVRNISSGGIDVQCRLFFTNGDGLSHVFAESRRLTAVKIADTLGVQ